MDLAGGAVSTGTAGASGKRAPSYVLEAIGAPEAIARAALRISFGPRSTEADLTALLAALDGALETAQTAGAGEARA